jgi:carboxypeptidase C (cathepsin A)
MRQALKVPTSRDYLALTLDVNFRWNWTSRSDSPQFYVNATPNVAALLAKRQNARVLLMGGLFDLAVPAAGPRYALLHAGLPTDRLTMKTFVAGHSPFDSDESRAQVSAAVHEFIAGKSLDRQGASLPAVKTRHAGTFNGKRLSYTASVESFDVPDARGSPAARLVSFSYEAEKPRDAAKRPVLFAFNGGPIVASQWLHIGILGPKRVEVPEDPKAGASGARLVDNVYSPLDVADVVLIDPASTGFSRVLPGTSPESYFSVAADGQQVATFIAAWLERHGRTSSPIYILGESYGTMRAVEVAGQLAEMPKPILADGVVLFGQAINIIEYCQRPQNIVSYVVSLPTLAAIAWYHGKVDRNGRTLERFVADADHYAQTEYLTALIQGSAIDPAERDRVAQKLESFSGISAAYYRDHALRITKEQYRGELLKDKGLLLGRTDARYVAPLTDKGIAPDPFEVVMQPFNTLFGNYLRDELKVDWPDHYLQDSPVKDLDGWDWGDKTPFSRFAYGDRLNKVMVSNPRFQVLVGNGYYDTQTTIGAAELAVRQSGWPAGRARLEFYEGGHMAYSNPAAAKKLADDLRAFMTR